MKVFEVRNFLSIIMAKEIIKNYKIKDYKFLIPYLSEDYLKKMKSILNVDENLIMSFDENIYYKKNPLRYIIAEKKIKKLLEIEKIEELYLCNTHGLEKHLYLIFKNRNKNVNFFEEGMNCYFDYFSKKEFLKNSRLKKYIYPKFKKIYFNSIIYDNVYVNFCEAYQYKDYKNIHKIKLQFEILENRKRIENLFLTRPLSEDNIIDEDTEIELIISYLKKQNNSKIFFKNHPRESIQKIQKIQKILIENNIKVEILKEECSAEELIKYYDIRKLIGFETGTLIYLSENYNIRTDSLLKTAVEKSNNKHLESFYYFYKENFKKINYI